MSSSEESGDNLSVHIDEEFSDEEHSLIRRIFEESYDEEEFEGFPAQLPENMAWNRSPFKNNLPAFTLNTDPAIQLPDNGTPLDFFMLFFEQELFVDIVKFTNKKAELKQAKDWVPLTVEELKAFLAFQVISNNILVVPRDERYFFTAAKSEFFHTPGLRRILSSRRFFQIKNNLYILLIPITSIRKLSVMIFFIKFDLFTHALLQDVFKIITVIARSRLMRL